MNVIDAKTVKVEVARSWQHPLYKKYVKRTKNYMCGVGADMKLEAGDTVTIMACRPLSKTKRFMVTEKLVK